MYVGVVSEASRVESVKTVSEWRPGSVVVRVQRGRSRSWIELVDPAHSDNGAIVRVFREDLEALEAALVMFYRTADGPGKGRR